METKTTGREAVKKILNGYRDALDRSDGLIAQHEALEDLENPTSSQLARMEELEKTCIPAAIAADKALKEKVRELLALPEEPLEPYVLQIFEMRYLGRMEWNDIAFSIYGNREDFLKKSSYYLNRVHKVHGRGIEKLGAAIDQRSTGSGQ